MEATPIQAIDFRIIHLTNEIGALQEARRLILNATNGNGSQATTVYSDSPAYTGSAISQVTISKPKPKPKRATKTRTRTRAKSNGHRSGQRQQAIVELLKTSDEPLGIPSIAQGLGMKQTNYLYRALPRLANQGLVKSTADKPPRWTLA